MLAPVILVLLAAVIGFIIWKNNGEKERSRERGWSLFILVIGLWFSMAVLLRLPVPNPTDWISNLLAPIYKPILAWIEEGT
ncbi:hypothetical protein [Paenibacillus sinopodophylli]|uniref:hypothetical protein n=1 Tax=Paenibacillus sinopodophylli TaxID=1837342 RepID=UPI00110D05E2|nr:hypothetical protein [Paenibacillus sinopodophylli]